MTAPRSMRGLHTLLLGFALAGTLSAAARTPLAAQAGPVSVKNAWVREAPEGRKVTGIFLTLMNAGAVPRAVVSGSTEVADTLELHEMKRDGEMMRMSPVQRIEVPAGGQVELRPGGFHLMIFGLKKPLVQGDTVRVMLMLDDGSRVAVAAPVRPMGAMP